MEKNKLSKNSSLLVSLPAICLWLLLTAVCAAVGFLALSGLFLFFALLFSFVRFWAARAMEGVSLEVSCHRRQLFPGMETELEYTLRNDKLLPLVWLELSQQRAEKDCVIPDNSFEAYEYLNDNGESIEQISAYKRGFSLVMAYESISLSSVWKAQRRGIYCPSELLLRSGNSFGLSQVESKYPADLLPEIVVYPRRLSVDVESFLRQDWDKAYGAAGFKEDMSVLRGLRPYTASDSWKRINWRMAARQPGELQVNFYETVQPASAVFILDGESYAENPDALEETLEVLGSVIEALCSKAVSVGLCLPVSKRFGALNFSPEQGLASAELLYYLAGYDVLARQILGKDGQPTGAYEPSRFELQAVSNAAMDVGSIAILSHKPSGLSTRLLERLERSRMSIYSSGDLDCADKELRIAHISSLRKGEKA